MGVPVQVQRPLHGGYPAGLHEPAPTSRVQPPAAHRRKSPPPENARGMLLPHVARHLQDPPAPPFETPKRAGKTQIQKVRALCPFRVWILRQPPPTKGRPKPRDLRSTPSHAGLRLPPGPPFVRESGSTSFTLNAPCALKTPPFWGKNPPASTTPRGLLIPGMTW